MTVRTFDEPPGGWGHWTVVMCKPDATDRRLVEPILEWIAGTVTIVRTRQVIVTARQILAHYADMLELRHRFPFDLRADLIDHYVGSTVTVALARGRRTTPPSRYGTCSVTTTRLALRPSRSAASTVMTVPRRPPPRGG
ncbi:hypothetical protein ACWEJ6_42250 [Nonomuraea sp. NPDC004702]